MHISLGIKCGSIHVWKLLILKRCWCHITFKHILQKHKFNNNNLSARLMQLSEWHSVMSVKRRGYENKLLFFPCLLVKVLLFYISNLINFFLGLSMKSCPGLVSHLQLWYNFMLRVQDFFLNATGNFKTVFKLE
jgi:hypothetical protein